MTGKNEKGLGEINVEEKGENKDESATSVKTDGSRPSGAACSGEVTCSLSSLPCKPKLHDDLWHSVPSEVCWWMDF